MERRFTYAVDAADEEPTTSEKNVALPVASEKVKN
jgi:hypothetical protein